LTINESGKKKRKEKDKEEDKNETRHPDTTNGSTKRARGAREKKKEDGRLVGDS